jgi:pimeloyl-ACP methyl ester carboxylesterase
MTMPSFYSDGLQFHYATRGPGPDTFFFQHGIGGSHIQPLRFLQLISEGGSSVDGQRSCLPQLRLAAFDFRAHGRTPVGDSQKLRLDRFADDLVAFMDHLMVERAVLGGISMGARQSADAAKSLLGQLRCVISEPSLREAVLARLHYLPGGQPGVDLTCAATINVPTLVLATPNDPIHPRSYAQSLAARIPGALYVELAPKQLDESPHIREVNAHLVKFLVSIFD